MNAPSPAPRRSGRPWLWAWLIGSVLIGGTCLGQYESCQAQLRPGPGEDFYEGVGGMILLGVGLVAIVGWGLILGLARVISRRLEQRNSPVRPTEAPQRDETL